MCVDAQLVPALDLLVCKYCKYAMQIFLPYCFLSEVSQPLVFQVFPKEPLDISSVMLMMGIPLKNTTHKFTYIVHMNINIYKSI